MMIKMALKQQNNGNFVVAKFIYNYESGEVEQVYAVDNLKLPDAVTLLEEEGCNKAKIKNACLAIKNGEVTQAVLSALDAEDNNAQIIH